MRVGTLSGTAGVWGLVPMNSKGVFKMSRRRKSTEKAQRNTDNLPHIQESLCDFLFCLCYANGIMDVTTQADEKKGL